MIMSKEEAHLPEYGPLLVRNGHEGYLNGWEACQLRHD